MKLDDLLKNLEYTCIQGSISGMEVSRIVYDSRKAAEGDLFVCISGAVADGHSFAREVADKGVSVIVAEKPVDVPASVTVIQTEDSRIALAVLSAEYFGNPANELITIGITGTKGKTTTTYMIRSVLEASGIKTGLIGTIETITGDRHIPSSNTTPESYVIQETFREMADAGCKCVVMEVSSQGLMLHRTGGFTFDYGVFTNLAPDHIGPAEHKDLADYIYCKSLLFRQCRHGIFNADDSHLFEILERHTCDVETYGFSSNADLRASSVELTMKNGLLGVSYHMDGLAEMDAEISMPGKFSVYNSMIAVAICKHFNIPDEIILKSLSQVRVKGRVELLDVSPEFTVMIDYA
ncbi:MAG: UDP-N-acetylmuramyl-tripeptide synthetase, partial [Lachnospiraceae bacterium]|nr:UDP-N-acetylmuramyl-tripeptide synthetase [Lachnospiraceae bacterium]